MIGSFLTRGLVMLLGYAYPAYECYKTVEKNRPEIEQLRFWCQYWILVACLTVFERVGDAFVSWCPFLSYSSSSLSLSLSLSLFLSLSPFLLSRVPMYSEAKLAFFIYLWYPKTRGTTYVYESFFRPYLSQHERDIDHSLLELRTRAGDMAVIYWQRVSSYGQTRIFEILQYVAAQSTPRPPQQPQKRGGRANQVPVKPKKSPSVQPESEEAASSSSSSSDSDGNDAAGKEAGPTSGPATDTKSAGITQIVQKLVSSPPTQSTTQVEAEPMQIEEVGGEGEAESVNGNSNPEGPKETVMEQTIRMTRGRLRKTRSEESR
ncbi:HVA22-like protein i isoform X1 [Brassica rapa]|uniref:HVA22-like protein i isoform X1 n=1 Tax=Brassica campestris TaxID=3711 RepID=UPI00142D9CB7|nr:HVA22-like protein i isoform X1 [Brassica rapa]XP_033129192.1 HVA22-like protein i isoform X1 [Brassica rapa]